MTRLPSIGKFAACAVLMLSFFIGQGQGLQPEEQKLYNLIMQYRQQAGLPAIPVSPSLTFVAQTHAKDLKENYKVNNTCNFHSWSDKGSWTPVCYTGDHAQAKLMWNKPAELTKYKGSGFEIAFGSYEGSVATAETSLNSWKGSDGHNNVILNKGIWNEKWNAIGIGMVGNYAVVWFGNEADL